MFGIQSPKIERASNFFMLGGHFGPPGSESTRVSDPYSFFTDPDPDPEDPDGGQYGSGSNPDPGL